MRVCESSCFVYNSVRDMFKCNCICNLHSTPLQVYSKQVRVRGFRNPLHCHVTCSITDDGYKFISVHIHIYICVHNNISLQLCFDFCQTRANGYTYMVYVFANIL